jgi:hypothetical protein
MDPAYQIDETFAWFVPGKRGDHDLKFGAGYYYLPLHIFDATNMNATFTFSASDKDFNAADPRTYPDRFSIRVPGTSDFFVKGREVGAFVQDKWKVNSRLTASLGLRYDVEIVPIDETGNYLFSDPSKYPVDKNNFSPRVGATYTLDSAGTAVVRGGWGLYYQKTAYSNFTSLVSAGLTSSSFTVTYPTTGAVDPGPSGGRLPTDPFLVNGPVVNRALLASLYPSSATQKNTGNVNFDNPDRHLPYARQASIGIEKQIPGNMAVSADYVHLTHHDLYMLQDLNPGLRDSTSRTATLRRIDPNFTNARAVLGCQSRLGRLHDEAAGEPAERQNLATSARRTVFARRGIVTSPGATGINAGRGPGPRRVPESGRPRVDGAIARICCLNAALNPRAGGLNVSGVLICWRHAVHAHRRQHRPEPQRQLRVRRRHHSGAARNVSAITVVNKGGVNGARGPDYFLINARAAYRFKLKGVVAAGAWTSST